MLEFSPFVARNRFLRTTRGQLEHTQARSAKTPTAVEAVADCRATQAHADATEARVEAHKKRIAVNVRTRPCRAPSEISTPATSVPPSRFGQTETSPARKRVRARRAGQGQQAKAQERDEIDSGLEKIVDAVDDHLTAVQGASKRRGRSRRIRQQADKLTNEADLRFGSTGKTQGINENHRRPARGTAFPVPNVRLPLSDHRGAPQSLAWVRKAPAAIVSTSAHWDC